MKSLRTFVVLAGVAALCGSPASASAVYSQNFDTGSATFTTDSYWAPGSNNNGAICTSTNTGTCDGGAFGMEITQDETSPPNGYFLFEGSGGTFPTPPPSQTIFFESPSFAVSTFTNYSITFFLTNANTDPVGSGQQFASIQADINGLLGSPVTASGYYSDGIPGDQWQSVTFNWSSGSNTTAQLILHDFTATSVGNDFGIDGIAINSTGATVPEPGTFVMFGMGGLAGLAWFRRKAAARRSSV